MPRPPCPARRWAPKPGPTARPVSPAEVATALRRSSCAAPTEGVRHVLFVKGQAVASDSAQPMTSSRQGDLITVRFGGDERYDLPDALLTGG